jgi:hypothetical protein
VAAWIEAETVALQYLREGTLEVGKRRGGFHSGWGFGHPDLVGREDRFIAEVPVHFAALAAVLVEDRDFRRRAAAAFLLPYGLERAEIVAALLPAIRDPSALVRNNVLRVMGQLQEGTELPLLPLEPLLAALHYPQDTDRNKAGYALLSLVKRDPDRYRHAVLAGVGDVLVEMAAMNDPGDHDPAISVLEALSGQRFGRDAPMWRAWIAGLGL